MLEEFDQVSHDSAVGRVTGSSTLRLGQHGSGARVRTIRACRRVIPHLWCAGSSVLEPGTKEPPASDPLELIWPAVALDLCACDSLQVPYVIQPQKTPVDARQTRVNAAQWKSMKVNGHRTRQWERIVAHADEVGWDADACGCHGHA